MKTSPTVHVVQCRSDLVQYVDNSWGEPLGGGGTVTTCILTRTTMCSSLIITLMQVVKEPMTLCMAQAMKKVVGLFLSPPQRQTLDPEARRAVTAANTYQTRMTSINHCVRRDTQYQKRKKMLSTGREEERTMWLQRGRERCVERKQMMN